jgi:muramidase (phage lysozyme)
MTVSPGDAYALVYEQILAPPAGAPLDARRISEILRRVQGTWLSFSATRLRQFGYHFDTY